MEEREILEEWVESLKPYADYFENFEGKDKHASIYAKIKRNGQYMETHISFYEKHYCIGAEKGEQGWSDCLDYHNQAELDKTIEKVLNYLGLKKQAVQLTLF